MPTYAVVCKVHGEQEVHMRLDGPLPTDPGAAFWLCPICGIHAERRYTAPNVRIGKECGLQQDHVTGESARTPTP